MTGTWSTPVLISGGPIHLMDEARRSPEALLMADGRVAAVGTLAEMDAAAGGGTERIDLQGATAIPGLVDTHPHLMHFAARHGSFVDLHDATSHAEIVDRVAAAARSTEAGRWIHCTPVGDPYYHHRRSFSDLAEGRLPDRWTLDTATTAHPVVIEAWGPRTPGAVAFNSSALRELSLSDHLPDRICDVWIEKDAADRVTGVLHGSVTTLYCFDPYWTQLLTRIPQADVDVRATTCRAMAEYNAMGVTSVYEAHNMSEAHIETYAALHREGALTVRVVAALETENVARPPFRPLSLEEYRARLESALALRREGDDLFQVDGATLSEGGPCWSGQMRTRDPSLDPYGRPSRAFRFMSREKMTAFAEFCHAHGLRANFLAVGHVDHDDVLEVLKELAGRGVDVAAGGWLLQHAMLIDEAQAGRYAALGFDVTTTMSFSWGKGDVYGERIGPHVWADLVPLARLLRQGLNVGCGSDWGPKNPFEQIRLAQTHEFGGSLRHNDGPDHAVGRREALAMWTRRAGQVLRRPDVGTLVPGAHADVAVVDRDTLTCPLDELPDTTVLRTLLGGRTVHRV